MAFADAFETVYTIKYDPQHNLQRAVGLQLLTDNLTLFDIIMRNQVTTEKCQMIDLKNVEKG